MKNLQTTILHKKKAANLESAKSTIELFTMLFST